MEELARNVLDSLFEVSLWNTNEYWYIENWTIVCVLWENIDNTVPASTVVTVTMTMTINLISRTAFIFIKTSLKVPKGGSTYKANFQVSLITLLC